MIHTCMIGEYCGSPTSSSVYLIIILRGSDKQGPMGLRPSINGRALDSLAEGPHWSLNV